jgi:hypothetical protein
MAIIIDLPTMRPTAPPAIAIVTEWAMPAEKKQRDTTIHFSQRTSRSESGRLLVDDNSRGSSDGYGNYFFAIAR